MCQHGVETPERLYEARQVSCGASHTVAISVDDDVWVWGSGAQLGLGETRKSLTPVMLNIFKDKHVLKVHCGDYHSVVIVEHFDKEQSKDEKSTSEDSTSSSRVSYLKENPSPCEECNKLLSQAGNEGSIGQENVFNESDAAIAEPGNQTVDIKSEAEVTPAVVDDHFGDHTKLKDEEGASDKEVENKIVESSETVDDTTIFKQETDSTQDEATEIKTLDNETDRETDKDLTCVKTAAGDPLCVTGAVGGLDSDSLSEVQLRSTVAHKVKEAVPVSEFEDPLTKSSTSTDSCASSKSKAKAFLNEAETREFLAKQFEDDSSCFVKGSVRKPVETSTPKHEARPSADSSIRQDFGTLTSLMTSSISTFTSKAFGNITSVFSMSDDPEAAIDVKTKEELAHKVREKSKDRKSDKASDRSDSPSLDETAHEMSDLGDITTNVSLMSIPDAETSFQGGVTPEASPRKKREGSIDTAKNVVPASPLSVSKQSQSLRTIEAKQEQLRKRSSNFPAAGNT